MTTIKGITISPPKKHPQKLTKKANVIAHALGVTWDIIATKKKEDVACKLSKISDNHLIKSRLSLIFFI